MKQNINHYLVRTIEALMKQGKVGIGWSDFDFTQYKDANDVIHVINESYGIGRSGNQIRRYFAINDGDLIVSPLPYVVAIGPAHSGLIYDRDNWYEADRANIREVKFPVDDNNHIVTIPRTSFSAAFQRRIRVMGMTVNDLNEFADEIQEAYKNAVTGKDHSWKNLVSRQKIEDSENFRTKLLANIQSGKKTNLQAGGLGLEHLVVELLSIDGYDSSTIAKTAFNGFADADVRATRSDRFTSSSLLVQVKHHSGWSGDHGINQLTEIKNQHPELAKESQLVFVTSASVSDELKIHADKEEIIVIDGDELVGWIEQNFSSLKADTKESLGIYETACAL